MSDEVFWNKYYDMAVEHGNNKLCLNKSKGADWCHITMLINSNETGQIELRSKEHAEALHFMLGQMLSI